MWKVGFETQELLAARSQPKRQSGIELSIRELAIDYMYCSQALGVFKHRRGPVGGRFWQKSRRQFGC